MAEQQYSKVNMLAALAAGLVAFGFAPILVRIVPDTSPFVLVTYRTVFAALILLPFWLWKRSSGYRQDKAKEMFWMILAGCCLGLHFTCWLTSLYYTSVASASTMVAVHPVIMILVERLWFKRSFAKTTWIGVLIAFIGILILGISDNQIEQSFTDPLFGNLLALSAAVIFVIYLLIGQQIRQKREWIDYVFPVYFYAAITCLSITLAMGDNLMDIPKIGIWAGAGLAFGPQILGHGSMNYAVKFISPTVLSTLILIEPPLASILAFVFFDELPPLISILSMFVILAGIGLTWKRES